MPLVEYARDGDVGLLTLNRPEAGNAVNESFVADFAAAIEEIYNDQPHSVLISGRGRNFCLGGDVQHLAAAGEAVSETLRQMAMGFHDAQLRLCEYPAPIVSAIQGNAIGGGLGLALSADFIVCADTARFSTGYARLALSPDAGVSYFLTQALGVRRARVLLMDSRMLEAQDAYALGLVDSVHPAADLSAEALSLAQTLAKGPTAAFAAIKRLTKAANVTATLSDQLARETDEIVALARTETAMQAIQAIAKKTKPATSG